MAQNPLVSVIIPCYNHARFLGRAVGSVQSQSNVHTEIIVVNDGSTDATRVVCESMTGVTYIYQSNQGLSAARNTGFLKSKGQFILFLDADDYLYPDAITTNLSYLQRNPSLAFVSGGHNKVNAGGRIIDEDHAGVSADHYLELLRGNYIGMHATVLYTRWVLNEFSFDTGLKACEDYDMYFRISRKYPVLHHTKKIAAYVIHGGNMSSNIGFMLGMALQVHERQKPLLSDEFEEQAFLEGVKIWTDYYGKLMFSNLLKEVKKGSYPSVEEIEQLARISPTRAQKLRKEIMKHRSKQLVKRSMPDPVKRTLYELRLLKEFKPKLNNISWGDLERTIPFSTTFGYDRGGPVDRYYIERFLRENKDLIRGRVFEIGDNAYTIRFGEDRLQKSDVLHVYQANDTVTFVGDLTDAPQIPSDSFDCIILTQTLHLIYDFKAALKTCHRILKPGGTLLLTVPGITQIDKDDWKDYWLWSFTTTVMKKIFLETFPEAGVTCASYGNVYAATAFLYGMGLGEVKKSMLDVCDPSYQVVITVKATKERA